MFLRTPVLALVVLASATGLANAQTGLKDSVVIRNSTSIPLTYESKFNDGAWMKVVLQPGEAMCHFSNVLNPLDPTPRVTIRFMDLIPYDVMKYENVNTSLVADPNFGVRYDFRLLGDRLYLVR